MIEQNGAAVQNEPTPLLNETKAEEEKDQNRYNLHWVNGLAKEGRTKMSSNRSEVIGVF